jgi:hypothetical protein
MVVSSQGTQIIKLDRVEISAEPWRWEFAMAQRKEITRYFADQKRKQPGLWNGQILLLHRYTISNRVLHGRCFITEFANLLAWRDWNYPDPSIHNFFAAPGLCAADGAYLVGEMGRHTANAGRCYFPSGTPEAADLNRDGALDLVGNLRRELQEETGIELQELQAEPGWTLVQDRGIFALIKRLAAPERADQLRSRIYVISRVNAGLSLTTFTSFVGQRMLIIECRRLSLPISKTPGATARCATSPNASPQVHV